MKKLLACIWAFVLLLSFLTACDIFERKPGYDESLTCTKYENCAVFTFDDFPIRETASFELERTGLGEGAIYYQANLEVGALSIKYKDTGLIHQEQKLGEFTADDEMPMGGSGGYIEGDKITIVFESHSPVSGEVIIAFTEDAMKVACGNFQLHEHTYERYQDEIGHGYSYTCGCLTPPNFAPHTDGDGDGQCDDCGYVFPIGSPGVAQIVLDYEQSLIDELEVLQAEHPEYNYYYHSVDEVHCILILDSEASADAIVEKYDMNNLFSSAKVSALNAIKMISIIFERNEFTENMHQKIKQISEYEALVKNLSIDMCREWYQSYMPKIEYYTADAKELKYTSSRAFSVFDGKDVILKSKDEYDAYLDELLEAAEYDYEKERITAARDLYSQSFFEENALIITRMITRSSGSIKLTVNNLYVSGDKVYVVIRTDVPDEGTCDMQYAFFGFAVDKNDVADVNEVVTLE